eukprot:105248_1
MSQTVNPSSDTSNTSTQTPYIATSETTCNINTHASILPSNTTTLGTVKPVKTIPLTNIPTIFQTENPTKTPIFNHAVTLTNMTQRPSNSTLLISTKYSTLFIRYLISSTITSTFTFYSTVSPTNIFSISPTKPSLFTTSTTTITTFNIINAAHHPNYEEQSSVIYNDDQDSYSSAAYILTLHPVNNVCAETVKLVANDGTVVDSFGRSMSIDAYCNDDQWSNSDSNIICILYIVLMSYFILRKKIISRNNLILYQVMLIFLGNNGKSVNRMQKILANDRTAGDGFGSSVSIDGEHSIIGDWGNECAYIFTFDSLNNAWTETAKLVASDGVAGDFFGISVSIYDHNVIIGARGNECAYIFTFDSLNNAWTETAKLVASDGVAGDFFGISVS